MVSSKQLSVVCIRLSILPAALFGLYSVQRLTWISVLHPGLCFIFFLLSFPDYKAVWSQALGPVSTFIMVDYISCTLPFAFSVIYHTFMCHHAGERAYKTLLKLDVFGVWFIHTFGAISPVYVGLYCFHSLKWLYLLCYMLVSLAVLYYLLIVDCKRKRILWITVLYSFLMLTHLIRLSPQASTDIEAFWYYLAMDVISTAGAIVNALHLPERWLQGKVDYVLNGHTLMHIAAFGALVVGRRGFLVDMAWLNSGVPVC